MSELIIEPPLDDITGVTPKAAALVEDLLKKGVRYFGSSGASLTHQVYNPEWKDKGINPTLAKIGLDGERATTKLIKNWIKDKPNAVLVDSCHIKGAGKEEILDEELGLIDGGDTDHVLIIGGEIIIIDTKRWKSKRNYTVGDKGQVLRSGKPFPGGEVRMRQAIHLWLDYIDEDVSVTGLVLINAEETVVFRNRNWFTHSYRLVELDRFEQLLDEKWNKGIDDYDKEHINTSIVAQAVVSAIKPYDEYKRMFSEEALKTFK